MGTKLFKNTAHFDKGLKAVGQDLNNGYLSARRLEMGHGSAVGYITPEDNSNKTLKFGGVSGRGRFDIDLENISKIKNVPTPTTDNEVANKAYVDSIKTQIKDKVANSRDFADFKTKIAS